MMSDHWTSSFSISLPYSVDRMTSAVLVLTFYLISTATAMTIASTTAKAASSIMSRVAIIGGGVSGCASARRLAQLAPSAEITVYEIGRGPGGRASTRKTRSLPHLYINHGAPYADIRSEFGKSLLSSLGPAAIAPFQGVRGSLDSESGIFVRDNMEGKDRNGDEPQHITGANGEMSLIATSLIRDIPSIQTKYKTMVRGLTRANNGEWTLLDKNEQVIGSADWLVVAGSGVAHPRWSNTFGGEPPLIAAEQERPDPKLREALDAIGEQQVSPVLAVFFSCSGELARKWLSLDFSVANVEGSSTLSKVMVQSGDGEDSGEEWCSIVLHSTESFALDNSGVYGATSSAARVGDATSDASLEDRLIEKMAEALNHIPGMPTLNAHSKEIYDYGPVLHRWGNAFPKGNALPEHLSFVPSSKVAFCGDYVSSLEQARFGSFESALLSGTFAAEKIANEIQAKEL